MENYVQEAERVIKSLPKNNYGKAFLTTTQLRKIIAIANKVNNEYKIAKRQGLIKDNKILREIQNSLLALKVKIVYQSGRERDVDRFVSDAKLHQKIDDIGDSADKLEAFFLYFEALTAYHKLYGSDK